MTTSSVPETYSITLDDTFTSISSSDTITLTSTPSYYSSCAGTFIVSSGATGCNTITLGNTSFNTSSIDWGIKINEEWVNGFPEWDRIGEMCKVYPGLKIAFEKFKTTYYLVKDDYDTPKDKK